MIQFNNTLLLDKWNKLIMSIYKGNEYYQKLREKDQRISENEAIKILNNQINLLNMRKRFKEYITRDFYINFTIISNLNKICYLYIIIYILIYNIIKKKKE